MGDYRSGGGTADSKQPAAQVIMNKRIWFIFSFIALVIVAITVAGYTAAYFTDDESSQDNIVVSSENWTNPVWATPAGAWYASGSLPAITPAPTWYYRQPLIITNPGAAITNYPLRLNISYVAGKMNSDFSDMRFTSNTGALLNYWIESYTAATSAIVWVQVPSVAATPAATKILMYYGNFAADVTTGNESSITPLFNIYADFETSWSGNPPGWNEMGSTNRGTLNYVTNGGLQGTGSLLVNKNRTNNSVYGGYYTTAINSAPFNVMLMLKAAQTNYAFNVSFASSAGSSSGTAQGPRLAFYSDAGVKYYSGTSAVNFNNPLTYNTSSTYNLFFSNISTTSRTYNLYINDVQQYAGGGASVIPFANNVNPAYLELFFDSNSGTPSFWVDYVRVWRYVSVDYSQPEE